MTLDERKRKPLLTVWLIVIALLNLWLAYQFITISTPSAPYASLTATPTWIVPVSIMVALVNLGAVIALWQWRKVGFYLLAVTSIPMLVVNFTLGVQFFIALFPLYSVGLLWTLLQSQWNHYV
ncbi:MAG TPA: hypothetical protein VHO69_10190 [Phototrophicaceae bacterium]|nr:hypothetical protein [Phototrophicaceae bacterium]